MIRNFVAIAFLALFGTGGFFAWREWNQKERELELRAEEVREKARIIDHLTRSTRVAQAVVVDRFTDDAGRVMSKVRFVEVGPDGKPVSTKNVVVEGDTVYFDALVLKFDQELVGKGEGLRGKSLLLFRRLFGEHQKPTEGVKLDEAEAGAVPSVYRVNPTPSETEVELWGEFWGLANDPERAKSLGVRVAQGEAPYMKMEKGKIYELKLDHAGGLNITASPVPAVLLDEDG